MSERYSNCRNLDFLFVSYGGGHITSVLPVVHELKRQGYLVGVFALTTATGVLKNENLPWFSYRDLPQFNAETRRLGEAMQDKVEPNPLVDPEESIAYMGINFLELIQEHGEEPALARYAEIGRRAFLPVALMTAVLKDLSPKVLMSTNSPRTEHACFLAAESLGIPSLALIDQFGALDVDRMSRSGYGSVVCVLNDVVKQALVSRGRPEHHVHVTGNPVFDALHSAKHIELARQIRRDYNWSGQDLVVLWGSQNEPPPGDPDMPVKIEWALRRVVDQSPGLHLVVRYHPSQKIEFKPQSRVHLSAATDPLEPWLHAADVLITRNSTVGLQAQAIAKTLLVADFGQPRLGVSFSALGLAPSINTESELSHALEDCLLAKLRQSEATGLPVTLPVMTATQSIAKLLLDLLKGCVGKL